MLRNSTGEPSLCRQILPDVIELLVAIFCKTPFTKTTTQSSLQIISYVFHWTSGFSLLSLSFLILRPLTRSSALECSAVSIFSVYLRTSPMSQKSPALPEASWHSRLFAQTLSNQIYPLPSAPNPSCCCLQFGLFLFSPVLRTCEIM